MAEAGQAESALVRNPPRASPGAILAVVGFAVFIAADDLTVVTTMLRPIANDLGLILPDGLDDAAWIVNVYLIAFVAVMPLAGRLSDVVGRRRLLMAAFAVFLVGTVVIPLSSSMAPFLVGRVLTAVGGGAMVPVALAVVGDVYRDGERARALGTLGAIETLGWVWGPLYGALLVRFLDWRWQFWLNIPFALLGMALIWWALDGLNDHRRPARTVDWTGAGLLTATLVTLDLALLGNSEIQSVSGLDELQGRSGFDFRLLAPIAVAFGAGFVWHQRRSRDPLVDPTFYRSRNLRIALAVNALVGAALVIAMVDVPIFVNAVEIDLERSAVISGWMLAALTAAMTVASYGGGRFTATTWYRPPILVGLAAATVALAVMGASFSPTLDYLWGAALLALLGAGLGLVFAPTTAAVVEASPSSQRGAAAAIVMVVRLIGLSVGLAALTAWGLARFNAKRSTLDLPPITDPGFERAVTDASARLTAEAIAETFLAAAVVTAVGLGLTWFLQRTPSQGQPMDRHSTSRLPGALPLILGILAAGLMAALIGLAVLWGSLRDTERELDETRADLERVEQGAAGSAIVASQVLEISRQLTEVEPQISSGLDEAIAELENFGSSTLEFEVPIDEVITIDTDITIDRTFTFPIRETITIDQVVDTTIEIDTGIGFEVPVDVSVPVNVDVPIDLDVDVPINETVPVEAEVPVQLQVPIAVDLAGTELETLAAQLATSLRTVQDLLGSL